VNIGNPGIEWVLARSHGVYHADRPASQRGGAQKRLSRGEAAPV